MKKYIYKVYIKQYFEYWQKDNIFRKGKKLGIDCFTGYYHLIFAENETEAIENYKKTYDWENTKLHRFNYYNYQYNEIKNKMNVVRALKTMDTFNYLKENMQANEFLEYCKQEMYPIEVVIK